MIVLFIEMHEAYGNLLAWFKYGSDRTVYVTIPCFYMQLHGVQKCQIAGTISIQGAHQVFENVLPTMEQVEPAKPHILLHSCKWNITIFESPCIWNTLYWWNIKKPFIYHIAMSTKCLHWTSPALMLILSKFALQNVYKQRPLTLSALLRPKEYACCHCLFAGVTRAYLFA